LIAIANTIAEVRSNVAAACAEGKTIGVVPTMGALHEGHLSLIRAARERCDHVVVTIFVNPTQFGPNEDYDRYPRTFDEDVASCEAEGANVVFAPTREEMYPPGFDAIVDVRGVTEVLEGAHRPGHFVGVTTVVLKLFNIVQPDIAFFGQKDFQQQLVIRKMCCDLDLPVEIVTVPTVREPDGLAMSSRNRYLSPQERQRSLVISQTLFVARDQLRAGERDVAAVEQSMRERIGQDSGIEIDYVVVRDSGTLEELSEPQPNMVALAAVRLGSVRLIDNVLIDLDASTDG